MNVLHSQSQKMQRLKFKVSVGMLLGMCVRTRPLSLGRGPEAVGVFSCGPGYYLEGEQTVQCNIFGEWGAGQPDCRRRLGTV